MKQHPFEPTVVQVRRLGDETVRLSTCRVCHKAGREQARAGKSGRVVVYWQHRHRPAVEPAPRAVCDWTAPGHLWCCKPKGHPAGHHAHRGPRRVDVR